MNRYLVRSFINTFLAYRENFILTIVLSLLIISCQTAKESGATYNVLIKNVTIITETGDILKNQNLYISNDTISAIEQGSSEIRFEAKKVIDGEGKFLLPGLWDNHTHFRGGENLIDQNKEFLNQFLSYGITTVRDAGGDLTPQVREWQSEIEMGNLAGPQIYTSGPKLDGPNARWEGSIPVETAQEVHQALDSLQSINVDYVKIYDSTISREMYLEIIRQAESRGMITSGHMPFTVTLDEAIDAGLDNIEHLYYVLKGCSSKEKEITEKVRSGELGFWNSMSQLIETYDEETAQKTFAKLKSNNVYVTPTLYIGEVLSYLDEVDHSKDEYLSLLQSAFIETYQGRIKSALGASEDAKETRKSLQKFFNELVQVLQEADVKLLAGSDSGAYNSYVYPGRSLHSELHQMVKAGLTPAEALHTSYRGAVFSKKYNNGIATGKPANLILLNSNPLDNIKNTLDINLVVKDGMVVYSKND